MALKKEKESKGKKKERRWVVREGGGREEIPPTKFRISVAIFLEVSFFLFTKK